MGGSASRTATGLTLKHCTLWKADRSPACRAVMMALDAMNLSVNEIDVNMDKGEHKSPEIMVMNNLQTLPVFKDRDLVLHDSHAINAYLVSRYCNNGYLMPQDAGGRSLVEQMMFYNSGVLQPKYRAAAEPVLQEDCRYVMPQHVCEIECAYSELENMLCGRTWFNNNAWPMLSDICICGTVSTMNVMVPIDKSRYPRLSSWLYRISEEMFYLTANAKGLGEFSRRIDCGQLSGGEKHEKCLRMSTKRRTQQQKNNFREPSPSVSKRINV